MKSVVILIDYFGSWPKWFPVFLASCRFNSSIDWIIRTDCEVPINPPANVKFITTHYVDFVANVSKKLNINFRPDGNYKICDIRPMYGDLYYDDIRNYDYYGFGDIDVIYGDIRKFYTNEIFSFDVISTHADMLSGHFALFKNTEPLRKAYMAIPRWKEYLEHPTSTRFDEDVYSFLFMKRDHYQTGWALTSLLNNLILGLLGLIFRRSNDFDELYRDNIYFKEQYSTVFHPMPWHDGIADHPDVWFWKDGVISNDRNIGREYLYLHLMNFQSMRWTNSECRKHHIPWKENPDTLFTLAGEEKNGVKIDWAGIHPLA